MTYGKPIGIETMLSQDRLTLLGQNEQRKARGQWLVRQDDQSIGRSDSQRRRQRERSPGPVSPA